MSGTLTSVIATTVIAGSAEMTAVTLLAALPLPMIAGSWSAWVRSRSCAVALEADSTRRCREVRARGER